MTRHLALALSALLAAPLAATPPVEPKAYTVTDALMERFDPATLEHENDPPRRTVFFNSSDLRMGATNRGGFLRTEGDERVLLDVEGAGVVIWMRFAERRGKLLFRFDGAEEPQWEVDVETLLNAHLTPVSNWLVDTPLEGGTLHMPITFASGLTISVVDAPMSEYYGAVSVFPPNTKVETWWPMAPTSPEGFAGALEFSRRVRRSDLPPWREDAVLAEISTTTSWRAAEHTLITAIEVDPFVEGDRVVLRLPVQQGTEEFDVAPFLTPVRPKRSRVTPTPAPPAPGIRFNERGVKGPASTWDYSPARAIFHIPFRVDVGEEIVVRDAVAEHAGVIRLRGRKLSESERLAAPRLAVSKFDDDIEAQEPVDAHVDMAMFGSAPDAPVIARLEGVGRLLTVWGRYSSDDVASLALSRVWIDTSDQVDRMSSTFGGINTLPSGPLFSIQPTQPDPLSDAAIPPRLELLKEVSGVTSFHSGGLDFAAEMTAGYGCGSTGFDPRTRVEVIALGQRFDGPAPARATVASPAEGPAGRISVDSLGETGLPILKQVEPEDYEWRTISPVLKKLLFDEMSMVALNERAVGERVLSWQAGEGEGEELRVEVDGSIVLDVDPEFVAMPGDRLLVYYTLSQLVSGASIGLDVRFEPHSGNEAFPYFSKRVLAKRGENGIVRTRLICADEETSCTVKLGDNASWTGSRHDSITLKPGPPSEKRLTVSQASLHRISAMPKLDVATARVPLLAREGRRDLDLYPGAEVYLRGRELLKRLEPAIGWTWLSVEMREWPQARLEEIEAWPLGFRYKLPANGWPSLDNVQVAVFDTEAPTGALQLTHPALKGARRLAVRFGTCPDGARVLVVGSDGRRLACEDTFMTESVVPATYTMIELGEPNPEDHIFIVSLGSAPGSTLAPRIVIEGVDILATDAEFKKVSPSP